MRLNAAPALVALLLSLVLAAPAGAAGEAGSNIRRAPGDSAAFTLSGSNGYRLYFKSEKGLLTITVTQTRPLVASISPTGKLIPPQRGAASESVYTTRVSRDPTRIEADLGEAGEVSLVFHPSGEERVTPVDLGSKSEHCVGATKITRRLGTFLGSVSFQGEHGYTTAAAISVPGTVGTSPFRNCTTVHRRPAARAAIAAGADQAPPPMQAAFTVNGPGATFLAFRNSERSNYFAFNSEELAEGFFVSRAASAAGPPGLFTFRSDGRRAHLKPPAPFSGAATFADPPSGPRSWSGSLAVSFPDGEQALTGKGIFRPTLRLPEPAGP